MRRQRSDVEFLDLIVSGSRVARGAIIHRMSIWSSIQRSLAADTFWDFAAKDLITAVIAMAAFLTAATNVWVAYLRRRKLRCDVGDGMRIGYGKRPAHDLTFRIDVFALNLGARPGVITRMAIELQAPQGPVSLHWTEITKTENLAPKGRGRDVWTGFAGFSSPVLVPKYDARLIEAAFWSRAHCELQAGVRYTFRLHVWVAGSKTPLVGKERSFQINELDGQFLQTHGTVDEVRLRGTHLYLTSVDGSSFSVPPVPSFAEQQEQRDAFAAVEPQPADAPVPDGSDTIV